MESNSDSRWKKQLLALGLGVGVAAAAAIVYANYNQREREQQEDEPPQTDIYETTNPNAYEEEFQVMQNDTCGVCLEEENCDVAILNCGHWIHSACLKSLLQMKSNRPKCPLCRTPIRCE